MNIKMLYVLYSPAPAVVMGLLLAQSQKLVDSATLSVISIGLATYLTGLTFGFVVGRNSTGR